MRDFVEKAYQELIREELADFVLTLRAPTINFGVLKGLLYMKMKHI